MSQIPIELLINAFLVVLIFSLAYVAFKEKAKYQKYIKETDLLLTSIRSTYRIILEESDIDKVLQKITDSVQNELKIGIGLLGLYDNEKNSIVKLSISSSQKAQAALSFMNSPLHLASIPLNQNNLLTKAILEKKSFIAHDFKDVYAGLMSPDQLTTLQNQFGTKSILIYPLLGKERPVGIFIIGVEKENYDFKGELDTLSDFMDLVVLVLENSKLLEELKTSKESFAKMTQTIYEMNAKLHQLDRLKDDFVSVASHELRTPMTAIRSYAWMALNRADIPLSEKLKKYLTRTMVSTERLINLVNDMLNISRIEAGTVEIAPKVFDLKELAKDIADEVSAKAREKGISVVVAQSNVPKVFADPDKVHQVLLNLVGNATKFTPMGGSITISFFTDGQFVDTSIKDSGIGISIDDLGRLFTKFGRLDNSYVSAATNGGTGLGLYISKSLVSLMKGKIWAVSEGLGKGSTFTFSLPIATQSVLSQAEKFSNLVPEGQRKSLEPVAI